MKSSLLIAGVAMLGFLLPELLAAISDKPAPLPMNFFASCACAFIAASSVL